MHSLSDVVFHTLHLPFTVVLFLISLYWLMVVIGFMDIETFDLDFGGEVDAAGLSAGMAFGKFFYLGEMPLMILLSLFGLSSWTASILLNHQFNASLNIGVGLLLLGPNLIISLGLVRLLGKPFSKFFNVLQRDLKAKTQMVGMPCKVMTTKVDISFGQAQIETETSPIVFNAITREGEVLKKGDQAVILEYLKHKNTYVITSFN